MELGFSDGEEESGGESPGQAPTPLHNDVALGGGSSDELSKALELERSACKEAKSALAEAEIAQRNMQRKFEQVGRRRSHRSVAARPCASLFHGVLQERLAPPVARPAQMARRSHSVAQLKSSTSGQMAFMRKKLEENYQVGSAF